MDKITNNILNNIQKNDLKDTKKPGIEGNVSHSIDANELGSNVIDIKETKALVSKMAENAPVDIDKVAKIKKAISSGKYPLDLDKLSDALMQAYREMKS